ncbi:protein of unknown function [Candidatus Promineifilum breve]|uniref:Uncharacterized protein n=1 Tax=Candidatus Promineifilum breve TaxID=1806508 RepID=A0A160SZ28_9CHLR|nr:protein of unknown function [Candidatus Promineifilum breve]
MRENDFTTDKGYEIRFYPYRISVLSVANSLIFIIRRLVPAWA